MTRRDGYSTNEELFVDFTTASRDLFVASFETHMQGNLPPAYEDKPLSFLGFEILKRYLPDNRSSEGMTDEELSITPLNETHIDSMKERLTGKMPLDVFEYYKKIVTLIGQTALSNETDLRSVLPPSGVRAMYTAGFPDNKHIRVGGTKEKSNKQAIVAARYFADEARDYITSDQSQLPVEERLRLAIRGDTDGIMRHRFSLRMTPELPLNGREGTAFLYAYRDRMLAEFQAKQRHLDYLIRYDAPESSVANARAQVDIYEHALARVLDILS